MNLKTVNVVAAIIIHDGKCYATQRGYGEFKDKWEFPGGKIEEGETPEKALIREIMEELETEIKVDGYFDTIEYDYPNFHLSMKCYFCSVVKGNLHITEHEDAKWLSGNQLDNVEWLPADYTIIEKLKKYI